MTTIYWLNPLTGNSTASHPDAPPHAYRKMTAPGYSWSVGQENASAAAIWGVCNQSRLHYRTDQNPLVGGTWKSVAADGVQLMYNDPVTQTWKPVCSADSPIYGNIDGQWVPLCCGADDYTSAFS